jgi:hypothetical protein
MNTILHWPLFPWRFAARPPRRPAAALPDDTAADDLAGLDPRLLRDIGVPEAVLSRAIARRETLDQCLDELRLGSASGGWRHW